MKKPAKTAVAIHPLLQERWSPRSFDPTATMSDADVISVLEAARWAPSSNNAQPWRFIVARRGEESFDNISSTLAGFNKSWAPNASAFIVGLCDTVDDEGNPRPVSPYDLGLAVSDLVMQAVHLGYHTHQIGGFNRDTIKTIFSVGPTFQPMVIIAIGKIAPADLLEGPLKDRELAERSRKPLEEIVLTGLPQL